MKGKDTGNIGGNALLSIPSSLNLVIEISSSKNHAEVHWSHLIDSKAITRYQAATHSSPTDYQRHSSKCLSKMSAKPTTFDISMYRSTSNIPQSQAELNLSPRLTALTYTSYSWDTLPRSFDWVVPEPKNTERP